MPRRANRPGSASPESIYHAADVAVRHLVRLTVGSVMAILLSAAAPVRSDSIADAITRAVPEATLLTSAASIVVVALLVLGFRRCARRAERQGDARLAETEAQLSSQRDAAAEFRRARDIAVTANEAKSRYMVAVSHEIRSPLNAIYGYAQLLERDPEISRIEAGGVIRQSVEHLTNLVEGVLEISRIETGVLKIRSDIVDFPALIDAILGMFRMQAAAKGLTLDLVITDRLPFLVRTDEKRLRQILINLVSNAIKYTQQGGATITIGYRSQVADITVSDTGIGIAPEDMERIFQPFERGHSPDARFQPGIGLGLSITRVLARILGGDLVATSTPGVGSRFRLRLMLPEPPNARLSPDAPSRQIVGYEGPRRQLLIVDDDAAYGAALCRFLTSIDFTVHLAGNGEEGLALAERHAVDMALLDIQMPGMSGGTLAARLRAAHEAIRIVMVSSDVQGADPYGAGDDGGGAEGGLAKRSHDGFVAKPVAFDALLSVIGTQLDLCWRRAPVAVLAAAEASDALPAEAEPFLDRLRQLAKVGHVGGIEATLDELEAAMPAARPLVAILRGYAEAFDLKSLAKALDHAG